MSDSEKYVPAVERRRDERVPVNHEFAESGHPTYVSDLSSSGVFIHCSVLEPIGSEIEVRFTVLEDDPIPVAVRGRVVRHQRMPRGMGVEFTFVDPTMIQRIEQIVARGRPRELLQAVIPSRPDGAPIPSQWQELLEPDERELVGFVPRSGDSSAEGGPELQENDR